MRRLSVTAFYSGRGQSKLARSVGFAEAEDVFSGLSAPESPFGQSDHMGQNYQPPRLTGAQIRAGRALLRWSAEDLARRTALGVNTIGGQNSRTRRPHSPPPMNLRYVKRWRPQGSCSSRRTVVGPVSAFVAGGTQRGGQSKRPLPGLARATPIEACLRKYGD